MPPDAPVLHWAIGHHPFLLEYTYNVPDVAETRHDPSMPDYLIHSVIDREASEIVKKWLLLVLFAFSRDRVFQYAEASNDQSWFQQCPTNVKNADIVRQPLWGQKGYNHPSLYPRILECFSSSEAAAIPLQDTNQYYRLEHPRQYVIGVTEDQFSLPERMKHFLDTYKLLADQYQEAFLASSYMLKQGLELFYSAPSLSFAACVSSIEALVQAEHRGEPLQRCSECGQPRYHVRRRFIDFMRTYGEDSEKAKRIADKVYKRRSAVLHQGQLYLGEAKARTLDSALEWSNADEDRRNVIPFIRLCLINWLISHASEPGTP